MPTAAIRTYLRRAPVAAAVALLCTAMGYGLVQHSKLTLIPVGLGAGVAFLLIIADLGFWAMLAWPPLGVIFYPISNHLPGHPYVAFDRIWVGGLVVLLGVMPAVRSHAPASRRVFIALSTLAVVIGIRTFFTPYATVYPERVWFDSLVLPLILFAVVRRAVTEKPARAEQVAASLAVAGLILGLIGLAEQVFGFELATASGSTVRAETTLSVIRLSGPYDVPEVYGLSLVLCMAGTLYWLLMSKRSQMMRMVGFGIVGIEILATFFTYFRVGWLSALVVVFAAFGLRPRNYGRAVSTALVGGAVVFALFALLQSNNAVTSRVNNTSNLKNRLATYEQGLQIFGNHPWFGVGSTLYAQVSQDLPPVFVGGVPSVASPHSSFIGTLAEDGIFGFAALIFAFAAVWLLIRALNRRRQSEADSLLAATLLGAGISYLAYSLTLTMLPYSPSNELFAILLGLGAARLDQLWLARKRGEGEAAPVPAPRELSLAGAV